MHLYEKIKSSDYVTAYLWPKNVQPEPALLSLIFTLNSNQGMIMRKEEASCPSMQFERQGLLTFLQGKEVSEILCPAPQLSIWEKDA